MAKHHLYLNKLFTKYEIDKWLTAIFVYDSNSQLLSSRKTYKKYNTIITLSFKIEISEAEKYYILHSINKTGSDKMLYFQSPSGSWKSFEYDKIQKVIYNMEYSEID